MESPGFRAPPANAMDGFRKSFSPRASKTSANSHPVRISPTIKRSWWFTGRIPQEPFYLIELFMGLEVIS